MLHIHFPFLWKSFISADSSEWSTSAESTQSMIELPIEWPSVLNCRPSLLSQYLLFFYWYNTFRSSSNKLLVHWFFRDRSPQSKVLASTRLLHDVWSSVHNIHQIVFKISSLEEACWVHRNCKVTGWDSSWQHLLLEFSVMIFASSVGSTSCILGPILRSILEVFGFLSGAPLDLLLNCSTFREILFVIWMS